MARPTLLDIMKANGSDAVVGLIDEAARLVPEVSGVSGAGTQIANVGAARTIKGRSYKTLIRTALPSAAFRDANEGTAAVKSTYENRTVETYILNPRWECDKAVADSYEDGSAAYIALEAGAILQGALLGLGAQFYYGRNTGGAAKGHPGLIDSVDSSLVVDATGTTASTGSSLWAVKFGGQAVQWVLGQEGQISVTDVRVESIVDAGGSNRFTAYVQELLAYAGVQVGHKYACGRIKNITADSGKGLTDARISTLLSKFPVGMLPDVMFCSRRSLQQLQASRTATNATGAPAPFPTEAFGIPIIPTDSLLDTEALT